MEGGAAARRSLAYAYGWGGQFQAKYTKRNGLLLALKRKQIRIPHVCVRVHERTRGDRSVCAGYFQTPYARL